MKTFTANVDEQIITVETDLTVSEAVQYVIDNIKDNKKAREMAFRQKRAVGGASWQLTSKQVAWLMVIVVKHIENHK